MSSRNQADLPYEQGCAAQIKHIFSTNKDVQYKQIDHQVLVLENTTKNTFHGIINLTYISSKNVNSLWQAAKIK